MPYQAFQQQGCWLWLFRFAIALSTGILFTACEPNEMYPIPVGGPAAEPNPPSQTFRPAQPVKPSTPPIHPMLDDPEAQTEDWEDDVFANSQEEAETKCRQKAEYATQTGKTLVVSLGVRPVKGKLFKCKFRSEVKP